MARQSVVAAMVFSGLAALVLAQSTVAPPQESVDAEAVPLLTFPGLAPEGAKWLVEHRRVKAVGIDTASIDHGPSTLFGSHVILCKADTPIFENLDGLDQLPEEEAFVVALPMKIAGGSGGPLRVLARLPDGE